MADTLTDQLEDYERNFLKATDEGFCDWYKEHFDEEVKEGTARFEVVRTIWWQDYIESIEYSKKANGGK